MIRYYYKQDLWVPMATQAEGVESIAFTTRHALYPHYLRCIRTCSVFTDWGLCVRRNGWNASWEKRLSLPLLETNNTNTNNTKRKNTKTGRHAWSSRSKEMSNTFLSRVSFILASVSLAFLVCFLFPAVLVLVFCLIFLVLPYNGFCRRVLVPVAVQ